MIFRILNSVFAVAAVVPAVVAQALLFSGERKPHAQAATTLQVLVGDAHVLAPVIVAVCR